MIVYGNRSRLEPADAVAASVARILHTAGCMPAGIDRHAALVRAFIRASELVQGNADAEFQRSGFDARSARGESGAALLAEMAAAVDRSWQSGFCGNLDVRPLAARVRNLLSGGWIRTRTGEGYAHYALYPESYLEAARRSGLGAETCVIGIRSIGTGLAALVAAALGARPPASVRPVGHPFDREICAAPDLLDADLSDPNRRFAVVDEGPGLSGSSFASVAKWLGSLGVEPHRIHLFPSHDGDPGYAASAQTLDTWRKCPRHPARSEDVLSGPRGLREWISGSLGPIDGLEELPVASSLPRDIRFERRKFLARGSHGSWLVKFAGLGEIGERKLRDARALVREGFTPETIGLCYGFLVQKHVAAKATAHALGSARSPFLSTLGSYLAFRATSLGPPESGASLEELRRMAIENTARALGEELGRKMDRRLRDIVSHEAGVRRVRTDNRLHAWEWLATDRRFMKIDAVDHCEAHDMIGCQDIAWDVAGSIAEHALNGGEVAALCDRIEVGGAKVDRDLAAALLPCYLAFQLGMWSTASGCRASQQADRYAGALRSYLGRHA